MSYEVITRDRSVLSASLGGPSSRAEDGYPQLKDKMESKLMSMWNNVKYGWTVKLRTNFSKELPVWLLGRCYHKKPPPPPPILSAGNLGASTGSMELGTDAAGLAMDGDSDWEGDGIEGFKLDFSSRLWLTYRREFPVMNGPTGLGYSSDCGWGCMLRSGQMMLAQALVCHFLGRSWRWHSERQVSSAEAYQEDRLHRMIIKWFGDKPSHNSPLSIHTLVALGEASGKRAGDWYGPGAVSHLLKQAVKQAARENSEFDSFTVYVAQDCAVYIQDVIDECQVGAPSTAPPWAMRNRGNSSHAMGWKSLVLLVPLRLGACKLNQIYGPCLLAMLSNEYCIGIIGGRPKHSLYFIGYQEDKLIHLDPHYCQDAVDVWAAGFPLNTFHCRSPRKLQLNKIDPSCCIGFYLPTRADFNRFMETIQEYLVPPSSSQSGQSEYPMFVFCEGRSSQAHGAPKRVARYSPPPSMPMSDSDFETEEFEIL